VRDGWNVTGDSFVRVANGRLSFVALSDDMIVSSGYNIACTEVEAALLSHPAVAECGVVGAPDEARGTIVKAYVVLAGGASGDDALTQALQDHVKREIAPYKYPRAIEYVEQLPKTETGKLRRFALRQMATAGPASPSVAAE
jgi:2-aminobenzoate-CoA ligase